MLNHLSKSEVTDQIRASDEKSNYDSIIIIYRNLGDDETANKYEFKKIARLEAEEAGFETLTTLTTLISPIFEAEKTAIVHQQSLIMKIKKESEESIQKQNAALSELNAQVTSHELRVIQMLGVFAAVIAFIIGSVSYLAKTRPTILQIATVFIGLAFILTLFVLLLSLIFKTGKTNTAHLWGLGIVSFCIILWFLLTVLFSLLHLYG